MEKYFSAESWKNTVTGETVDAKDCQLSFRANYEISSFTTESYCHMSFVFLNHGYLKFTFGVASEKDDFVRRTESPIMFNDNECNPKSVLEFDKRYYDALNKLNDKTEYVSNTWHLEAYEKHLQLDYEKTFDSRPSFEVRARFDKRLIGDKLYSIDLINTFTCDNYTIEIVAHSEDEYGKYYHTATGSFGETEQVKDRFRPTYYYVTVVDNLLGTEKKYRCYDVYELN